MSLAVTAKTTTTASTTTSATAPPTATLATTVTPLSLPSTSTFSFKAPFPASLKQRRVSLALPSSPKLVPAFNFRDDTGLQSHVAETSSTPEKRGKMRRITGESDGEEPSPQTEKKHRKKWSAEETQMLVDGCNKVRCV